MSILYKNTDRLLRDAKKIRKNIRHTLGVDIMAQHAMDLVASCFGWSSWNVMYVASQNKSDNHRWWHEMRWREKVAHMHRYIASVAKAAPTTWNWAKDFDEKDIRLLEKLLASLLEPDANLLPGDKKPSSFFERFAKSLESTNPYDHFANSRKREGIYVSSNDTYFVAEHLRDNLLPSFSDPDCIVICDSMTSIDFVRAFQARGYNVTILNSLGVNRQLPFMLNLEERTLLPDLSEDAASPFSVEAYLNHCLDYVGDGGDLLMPVSRLIIKIIAHLSTLEHSNVFGPHFLKNPSLKELVLWSKRHDDNYIQELSGKVLSTLFGDPTNDPYLARIGNGKSMPAFEERYQYACMQFTLVLKELRDRCIHSREKIQECQVTSFERQGKKTVYLFPVDHCSAGFMHLRAMMFMLVERLASLPPSIESDMCLICPDRFEYTGALRDGEKSLNFKRTNAARVNPIFFGERGYLDDTVDTHISLEKEGVKVADKRLQLIADLG